jgi:flagellin-like protein
MRKGITPIIASIILLLIAVALGGSSWMYIYGYWGTMTSQNIDTMGSYCSRGLATVNIKNVGTDPINISDAKMQVEEYTTSSNTAGLWHINSDLGSDPDSSGNNNLATFVNNPLRKTGENCKFGACREFNDSAMSYINVSQSQSKSIVQKNFTLEAWIKLNSSSKSFATIFSDFNWVSANEMYGYLLRRSGSNIQFVTRAGGGDSSPNSTNVETSFINYFNKWTHVVATFNGSAGMLYLNGEFKGSEDGLYTPANRTEIRVGGKAHVNEGDSYFNGTIDEVRILNRSLTADEMKNQQTWGYVCLGSGNKYTCNDLTITKNSGGYLDPYFDKGVLGGYESTLMKDRNCNGNCEYYIVTRGGRASKVQLFNC